MSKIRHWRKMTWVLWVWCILILVWAFAGAGSADCGSEVDDLSQSACEAGAGVGVALVLFIGFIGFVFFGLIWIMSRPRHRTCARCGEDVRKGQTECPSCGQPMGQPVATA